MKLYGSSNQMIHDRKAVQLLAVFLVMGVQGVVSTTWKSPRNKLRFTRTTGCQVSVNGNGLPFPDPVILNPGSPSLDGFAFKRPQGIGEASTLTFATGENVRLACTGNSNNHFPAFGTGVRDITVTCINGESFQYLTGSYRFSEFKCSTKSLTAMRKVTSPSCTGNGLQFIEIGFEITPLEFVKIIDVCFDDINLNVQWTRFDLLSEIGGQESGFKRPTKFLDSYFPFRKADDYYSRVKQRATIADIIGNTTAYEYIQLKNNSYLSRGHLVASNDFIYNIQKLATYNLINVAPQWYYFNSKTWNTAEMAVRSFVASMSTQNPVNLQVYTGIHGNEKLPDDDGEEHDLYLNLEGDIPRIKVPAVFWKVLYDSESRKGIALVGVNNQLKDYETVMSVPGVDLCPGKHLKNVNYWEICNAFEESYQIPGFGYCCEVDHIRSSVNFPSFTVSDILTVN